MKTKYKYYLIIISNGPVVKLGPFSSIEERRKAMDENPPSKKKNHYLAEVDRDGELSVFGPIVSLKARKRPEKKKEPTNCIDCDVFFEDYPEMRTDGLKCSTCSKG